MKSEYINCKNCKDDCRCRGKNITPICVSFTPVKTTNADRIRAMTDEELAKLFTSGWFDRPLFTCPVKDVECESDVPCDVCFLDWLKSPVEVQDS